MIKRALDIVLATIGLIVVFPILSVAAILIKLDGGPILFRQERIGYKRNKFQVYKLRSMIVNADDFLDADGRTTRNRITKVGAIIRKFSIDELPQFVNILKGEMSLIGPRPILPKMLPYLSEKEKQRFEVRPGVTGLAQIKGRNFLKWSRRFHFDVIYVRRYSFPLDLWIIWQTIYIVCLQTGVSNDRNSGQVDDVTTRRILPQKATNIET